MQQHNRVQLHTTNSEQTSLLEMNEKTDCYINIKLGVIWRLFVILLDHILITLTKYDNLLVRFCPLLVQSTSMISRQNCPQSLLTGPRFLQKIIFQFEDNFQCGLIHRSGVWWPALKTRVSFFYVTLTSVFLSCYTHFIHRITILYFHTKSLFWSAFTI